MLRGGDKTIHDVTPATQASAEKLKHMQSHSIRDNIAGQEENKVLPEVPTVILGRLDRAGGPLQDGQCKRLVSVTLLERLLRSDWMSFWHA